MIGKSTFVSSRVLLRTANRRYSLQNLTGRPHYFITAATIYLPQQPRGTTVSDCRFTRKMATFSNADTGDKPSDPYYNKNIDTNATLKEKVETLAKFVSSCKFGMMTTRDSSTGKLVSRCMAVAGKVRKRTEVVATSALRCLPR